ncbi:hypothetical protein HDU92_000594 [Lobulomyces angularis]|nr:hypothetical protein HDU92_000594 [Lobulomyces angularis]
MSFSETNVLTNYMRGVATGIAFSLLIIAVVLINQMKRSIFIISLIISLVILGTSMWAMLVDILPNRHCFLKMKLGYSLQLFVYGAYWIFQAQIAYKLNSKHINTIKYMIGFCIIARLSIAILTITKYENISTQNGVCSTILIEKYNILEKGSEMLYSLVMAALIVMGLKKSIKKDLTFYTFIKKLIKDQTVVVVVTAILDLIYLIVVFTSKDPKSLSMANNIVTLSYPLFLILYISMSISGTHLIKSLETTDCELNDTKV